MINNKLQDAFTLDENSTHSDKLYNSGAVCCAFASLGLLVGSIITYFIDTSAGLLMWQMLFYPMVIFDVVAMYLSFAQILRNRYFSILLSSIISVLVFIALVVIIIIQATVLKKVYIIPFVYF